MNKLYHNYVCVYKLSFRQQPESSSFKSWAMATIFFFSLYGYAFSAGYEFEGIGARQVARAGAAVSDISDWTAIYWNPAGLASASKDKNATKMQIGLEGFGGLAKSDDGNSLSGGIGSVFGKTHLESSFILGSLGVVLPLNSQWVTGFGVYTPLLQGADFKDSNGLLGLDYKANAGIIVVNFSLSRAVNEKVLLGAGINAVNARLKINSKLDNLLFGSRLASDMSGSGWGPELMFGCQWSIKPSWKTGALYRTGSRISVKGDAKATFTGLPDEKSDFTYKFNHPATAAVGISYNPGSRLILGFDINHTNWRSFRGDTEFSTKGLLISNIQNTYAWRNTFKFRLGGIYALTGKTDLLAGVSYDNYALDNKSIDFSTTIDVPIFRFSGGLTHKLSDSWDMSAGVVMAKGRREVKGSGSTVAYTLGGWQGMLELVWKIPNKT